MRKVTKIKIISAVSLVVIIAAYTGAWFYASHKLQQNITHSITKLKEKGYHVEFSGLKVGGFPFGIRAKLQNLKISRIGYFKTWVDGEVKFSTTIFRPGRIRSVAGGVHHVEVDLDGKAIALTGHGFELLNAAFDGSEAGIKYKHIDVAMNNEPLFQADNAMVKLRKEGPETNTIEVKAQTWDLKVQMQQIKSPLLNVKSLGDTIKSVNFDAKLIGTMEGLTLPERLGNWSKNGGTVEMAKIAVEWGDLNIDANGTFSLDETLQPLAALSAKISGLDALLKTMVAEKIIDKNLAKAVKTGIEFFSVQDDDGSGHYHNVISVSLQNGALAVGPVTLLKVPKLKIK